MIKDRQPGHVVKPSAVPSQDEEHQARRRRTTRFSAVLGASIVAAGLLARFGGTFASVSILPGLVAWLLLSGFACSRIGSRPTLHGPRGRLMTATTFLGPRTIDLDQLVRVGRWQVAGKGPWLDKLVLTDARGRRLAVDDEHVDQAVTVALARLRAQGRPPRVTASAKHRLGLEQAPCTTRCWHFVLAMIVPLLLAGATGAVVIGAAATIAMA